MAQQQQSLGLLQAGAAPDHLEGSLARTGPLCSLGSNDRSPLDTSSAVVLCFAAVGSDTGAKSANNLSLTLLLKMSLRDSSVRAEPGAFGPNA